MLQTLGLAAAQVFATSLDTYFQLTIMLMVLVVGITVLAHYQPFEEALTQSMQVRHDMLLLRFKGVEFAQHAGQPPQLMSQDLASH